MRSRMAAVLALFAAPGLALAESVPFSVLADGDFGAPGAKQQLVIKSQQELQDNPTQAAIALGLASRIVE